MTALCTNPNSLSPAPPGVHGQDLLRMHLRIVYRDDCRTRDVLVLFLLMCRRAELPKISGLRIPRARLITLLQRTQWRSLPVRARISIRRVFSLSAALLCLVVPETASALVVTDAMSVLRPVETVLRRTRGGRPGLAIMTFRRRSSQTCFNRLEPLKELLNLFVVLTRTFIRGLPKDLSQD